MLEARTVTHVSEQPAVSFTQYTDRFVIDDDDIDTKTATESDLSLKSRSFLRKVHDRYWTILPGKTKSESQNVPLSSSDVQQISSNYSNGTLTTSGLLKCGNLVKCWEQVREDP